MTRGLGPAGCVVLGLCIGALLGSLPLCRGESAGWPPQYMNHTFGGTIHVGQDARLEIPAVGDVLGRREIIVWVRFHNVGNETKRILPAGSWVEVDGQYTRSLYYSSWSKLHATHNYATYKYYVWNHPAVEVPAHSSLAGWLIFELPKHVFDSMSKLSIGFGGIVASLNISSEGRPEPTSMITIEGPPAGRTVANLWHVKFYVVDTSYHPRTINWSVTLDGRTILEGNGTRYSFSPIEVDRSLTWLSVPDGDHELTVSVTDGVIVDAEIVKFRLAASYIPVLSCRWYINTSDVFSGMTYGAGHQGCQTVWDVDGDGTKEILFGTRRGHSKRLWCFGADARLEWIYPPLDQDGLPGDPVSKVSLVDVNRDGVHELCLAGRGGRLHVLDGDGHIVWVWDNPVPGTAMYGAPQAYDVDGDGFVEFFMTDEAGFVHRVNHNGQLVWTWRQAGHANGGHATICDINRDGRYEILWGSHDHYVYCISADSGAELWRYDTRGNIKSGPVIVADVNRDGEYEALIWNDSPSGAVICLSHSGTEIWRWALPMEGNIRICQALGDVDGDGSLDMVVMSWGKMYCLDVGGQVPVTKWAVNFSQWSEEGLLPPGALATDWSAYQVIADIDGDGRQEVLCLAPFPIVVDGATGELEAYYLNEHVGVGARAENGGWWGDVDGDGVSEWICELNGKSHAQTQVYCLTLGGRFPAESPWSEYFHCAYPAEYQNEQAWLTLKGAYSNSVWFPLSESSWFSLSILAVLALFRGLRAQEYRSPIFRS